MAESPDDVLEQLLAALAQARVPVALIGGYAVAIWGVPRATYDVDVLIEADEHELPRCFDALEQHGLAVDAIYRRGWRDRVRDMPLVKAQVFREGKSIANDLFLLTTDFQRSAFARARLVKVPKSGKDVRVITAADLILFKLMADRPKDRLDVQNVLTVQGIPEAGYLRDWARRLGVGERLDRALEEAGLRLD